MSLETQLMADMKQAMLAKDQKKLEALRAIKAQILLEKSKDGSSEISEATEIAMLQKLVKQRKESASIYEQNGRAELAENERQQAAVIEAYLPKQLSDDELKEMLNTIITEVGASSIKDMGKVMGIASKKAAGRADNSKISAMVKELLG